MNKEEILTKARNENKDEMEVQIRDKALKWTYVVMVVVAGIFAFIRGANNQPMMDLCVTICASVAVGQLYRFIKTRDKYCLTMGIVTLVVGIFALIRFCMGH